MGVFGQVLHGTVVVTGGGDEEGATLPLSDRDLSILETIIERLPRPYGEAGVSLVS